jgi:hypothetical protein
VTFDKILCLFQFFENKSFSKKDFSDAKTSNKNLKITKALFDFKIQIQIQDNSLKLNKPYLNELNIL